jgi:uncharacterized protein (TIRG00374 family)
MSWIKGLLLIIGLIFLGWIVYFQVDFKQVGEALYTFPKNTLLGVLLLSFLILSLKAARFWVLLHKFTIKAPFWKVFKISFAGGVASPLPGGEFFRGILIRHETKESFTSISGAIVSQSYFETTVAIVLMVLGLLVIDDDFLPFAIGALLFVVVFSLVITFKQSIRWIKHLFPKNKYIDGFLSFMGTLQRNSFEAFVNREKRRPHKVVYELAGITLIAHILGGLMLWLIFDGLGIPMGILISIFIYSSSVVIAGVGAIAPGGIGITEGGLLGLLILLGVQPSSVVAVILLFRLSTLIFSIILGAIFFIVFYGKTYLAKWRVVSI